MPGAGLQCLAIHLRSPPPASVTVEDKEVGLRCLVSSWEVLALLPSSLWTFSSQVGGPKALLYGTSGLLVKSSLLFSLSFISCNV